MQLEDYFDFLRPDDIRIKGHRVGIESVLYEYLYREKSPEAINQLYPTLSLDQIYGTILYYLQNKEQLKRYIEDWIEDGREAREKQEQNPPPYIIRWRKIKTNKQESIETAP